MQEHNQGHMQALLALTGPMILLSIYMLYWYLLQIEINKTLTLPTELESTKKYTEDGVEGPAQPELAPRVMEAELEEEKPRHFRITTFRHLVLLVTALAVALLTYLLLVLSDASLWLSLLGVVAVLGLGLWQQIWDELRRQRYDRLVAVLTIIFFAASCMSLATYARKSIAQGEIYQGKARIIGFDYEDFDNKEGEVTRSNLEVAWGGEWGCPRENGKQCTARVQGAMCESEDEDNPKFRRYLDKNNNDSGNDNGNGNNNNKNDGDQANDDALNEEKQENEDLEKDLEEEEEAVQEEAGEVEEEKEENEELEEEVEEYEEYAEDLEEEVVEAEQHKYSYDDDLYEDNYWDLQDWGSVWGEYACEDLFDYDMSGSTYNADEQPGEDDWPYINIYGNCKQCEAYIIDYFSTEHFQKLQDYKIHGRNYMIFSLFGLALTVLLYYKHKMDPIAEKELELLPNDGGARA